MSDEKLKPDEQLSPTAQAKSEQTGAPKPKKKRNKIIIAGVIVIAVVAAGIGMLVWHEQPSFCSTIGWVAKAGTTPLWESMVMSAPLASCAAKTLFNAVFIVSTSAPFIVTATLRL